jgi:hypothetical protein
MTVMMIAITPSLNASSRLFENPLACVLTGLPLYAWSHAARFGAAVPDGARVLRS